MPMAIVIRTNPVVSLASISQVGSRVNEADIAGGMKENL